MKSSNKEISTDTPADRIIAELYQARKILRRLEPLIISTSDGVIIDITSQDAKDIFEYLETYCGGAR